MDLLRSPNPKLLDILPAANGTAEETFMVAMGGSRVLVLQTVPAGGDIPFLPAVLTAPENPGLFSSA